VYAGSALGGLEGRLRRHLRTRVLRHWHLDVLLSAGQIVDVQALPTTDPLAECRLAAQVRAWSGAEPVPRFGASDCPCGSHLARFPRRPGGSARAERVTARLPEVFAALSRDYEDYTARQRDPFRALVSCVLSQRTRDPVTTAAAGRLFARWATAGALAAADPADLEACIAPVGMHRQKARRLVALAAQLQACHGGAVPRDLDALLALPGVGRKTANLVLSFAFHQAALCVDTHVHRIGNRWGLVRTATPEESERELRAVLPQVYWRPLNPFLVQHGQQVCRPRRPQCSSCGLARACGYAALRAERALLAGVPGAPVHPCLGGWLPAG